ncbi:MAG: tetratricopeptide repeat protein [Bacteroidales bacterium]|nr:tetratricopeptide repeat protein [Bacteroidales bacterium]
MLILVVLPAGISAQTKTENQWLSAGQLKNFAKNADRLGDVYTAIDYLERYCKIKPNDHDLGFRLAELYRVSRNYEKAASQYAKVYKNAAAKYPVSVFYQGQMLKALGKYEEAKEVFTKAQRKLKDFRSETINSAVLRDEIRGCEIAQALISKPLKISMEHLNSTINKSHIEFSPISLSDSILIYGSLKLDSANKFLRDHPGPLPVRQLYKAKKVGNDWIGGEKFSEVINMARVETGNGSFPVDGNRFYFTRCGKNWQNKMKCEIYFSENWEIHGLFPKT